MLIERKAVVAVIALAMLICAASPSLAAARGSNPSASAPPQIPGDALDAIAERKFGTSISSAERKLLHAAPLRDVPWFGPSDDPDNAANDTAHGENWGADRTVRADFVAWLVSDPQAAQFVHPSGLALAGARISGSLDLSYATIDKPLTLIRCYLPDGINLSGLPISTTSRCAARAPVRCSATWPSSTATRRF